MKVSFWNVKSRKKCFSFLALTKKFKLPRLLLPNPLLLLLLPLSFPFYRSKKSSPQPRLLE